MVLGEPQILGQLKDAFQSFNEADLTGKLLHPLFTRAFSTAKRVRTETSVASNAVSVSYAAVELAKHIFEDLSKQTVMVIGAGEMAELAVRHFMRNGISELFVTNRTFSASTARSKISSPPFFSSHCATSFPNCSAFCRGALAS